MRIVTKSIRKEPYIREQPSEVILSVSQQGKLTESGAEGRYCYNCSVRECITHFRAMWSLMRGLWRTLRCAQREKSAWTLHYPSSGRAPDLLVERRKKLKERERKLTTPLFHCKFPAQGQPELVKKKPTLNKSGLLTIQGTQNMDIRIKLLL